MFGYIYCGRVLWTPSEEVYANLSLVSEDRRSHDHPNTHMTLVMHVILLMKQVVEHLNTESTMETD